MFKRTAAIGFVLTLAVTPLLASTAEEIVAKHIKARGGMENWEKIKTLKATGTFTGFSLPAPFTLLRARPDKLYWDHYLGDKKMLIGHDGQEYWWINPWYGSTKPAPIGPVDAVVTRQDTEFATPFFDYKKRGFTVDYLGMGDLEGEQGHVLKLTRDDGQEETWYLHPETHLEIGRVSKGSDFGRVIDQKTFYSDFRKVGDVMIPFLTETEFGTRHRVLAIENVEINPKLEDATFEMPFPPNMEPVRGLLGDWKVTVSSRQSPRAEWSDRETKSSIQAKADGNIFVEEMVIPDASGDVFALRTLAWNQYTKAFTLTVFEDSTAHTNVFTGTMEDGQLTLSNEETGTTWTSFGRTFHNKYLLKDISADGFTMVAFMSRDKGENWFEFMRLTYTKP